MTETTPAKKAASPRASKATEETVWERLARPFSADEIEKLPKQLRRDDQDKGRCEAGSRYSADGHYCGGWHARSMHLDYVGHAGITMRLNEVVTPEGWTWEPMALDTDGLPIMSGEFWIKLTVNGVTKYGVGDDFGRSSKQAIGDALRNAAMRFGIATYLWSKSEASLALKQATDDVEPTPPAPQTQVALTPGQLLQADLLRLDPAVLARIQAEWPFPERGPATLSAEEVEQVRAWVVDVLANPTPDTATPGAVQADTGAAPDPT